MKITIVDDLHGAHFDSYAMSTPIPADFKPKPSFESMLKTIWADMAQKRGIRHKCDPNAKTMIYRESELSDFQPESADCAEAIVRDNFYDALRRLRIMENWNVPYAVGMQVIHDFMSEYPIDIDTCRDLLSKYPAKYIRADSVDFTMFSDGCNDACYTDAIAKIRKTGYDGSFILHPEFVDSLLHVYDPNNSGNVRSSAVMKYTSCFMEMAALLDESNPIDNTMAAQLWVSIRAFIKFGAENSDGEFLAGQVENETYESAKHERDYTRPTTR